MSISILDTSLDAQQAIASRLTNAFKKNLAPPPKLNLVEWADTYRHLPAESSSEAGKWKTDRVIAAKEMMLSISNKKVEQVTVMACTQLAKTELILNTIGFYMHQEPSPIIVMQPKKEMAEAFSKDRLSPMCRDSPVLKEAFATNRRDSGNTILHKQFKGGQITMVGSNSPADLAMRPCRIVLCDEVDKYPQSAGVEGDSISLLWERAATFGKRRKLIVVCSPTEENTSRVYKEFKLSDQREFYHECQHCKDHVLIKMKHVMIPKNENGRFLPDKAYIACPACGSEWSERDRIVGIKNHKWIAHNPDVKHHHGYRVSKFASPWETIVELARKYVKALDDIERLKTFYNTQLAEVWKRKGDQPDFMRLYERREDYKIGIVPDGVLMITCGIDVQKSYLAYEVVGWGRRRESWSIDKGAIDGKLEDDATIEALHVLLRSTYKNSHGINMPIEKIAIDSGYNTQEVYNVVRNYSQDNFVAVKGSDDLSNIIGSVRPVDVKSNGKTHSRGLNLWTVGSSVIKEQFYRWLSLDSLTDEQIAEGQKFPSGYSHFPQYDQEFFKQITAEQYTSETDKRGFVRYFWEKIRKDNHYLDCRVYARAASSMLGLDRMQEGDFQEREDIYYPSKSVTTNEIQASNAEIQTDNNNNNKAYIKRRTNWIKR